MKNNRLMSKVITGVLAGGILLGATGLAYADDIKTDTTNTKATTQHQMKKHKAVDPQKKEEAMKKHFDKFVTDGTISQDQENKILDFIKQKETEMQAKMDKIKAMTKEERKAYFEQNPKVKTNLFSQLVTAGIISQDQADKMAKTMAAKIEKKGSKDGKTMSAKIKTQLDKLVSSSLISQDQENKILDYMKQKEADRKAEMDKIKAMTKEERKAYFEQNIKNKQKTDFFADLVNQGILTQDQVAKIKAALPQAKQHHQGKEQKTNNSAAATN